MKEDNNIDKLFSDKIDAFEMTPEKDIWGSLDNQLNKKANIGYKSSILKLKVLLLATATILGVFTIYHFSTTTKEEINIAKEEVQNTFDKESEQIKTFPKAEANPTTKEENPTTKDQAELDENSNSIALNSKLFAQQNERNTTTNKDLKNEKQQQTLINSHNEDVFVQQTKNRLSNVKVAASNKNQNNSTNNTILNNSTTKNTDQENLTELAAKTNVDPSKKHNNNNNNNNNNNSIHETDETSSEKTLTEQRGTAVYTEKENVKKETIGMKSRHFKTITIPQTQLPKLYISPYKVNNETSRNRFEKWYVAVHYTPERVFTTLRADDSEGEALIEEYRDSDASDFSYSTGLNVGYHLTPKWKLTTGLSMFSYVQNTDSKTLPLLEDEEEKYYIYTTSYGDYSIHPYSEDENEELDSTINTNYSSENIQLISLPLYLSYKYNFKRFYIDGELGFHTSRIMKDEIITSFNTSNYQVNSISTKRMFHIGMQMGIGFGYYLTPKLSVALTPQFKKSFTSINHDTDVQTSFNSMGLSGKISWNF